MTTERDIRNQNEFALEQAMAKGIKRGREEGIAEGEARGREEGIRQTALKLKEQGLSFNIIVAATGISVGEIERL